MNSLFMVYNRKRSPNSYIRQYVIKVIFILRRRLLKYNAITCRSKFFYIRNVIRFNLFNPVRSSS